MTNIPIFDSLTHPTIDGTWLSSSSITTNTAANLLAEMSENNIQWACAAGLKDVGKYDVDRYAEFIQGSSEKLFPVAFCDFTQIRNTGEIAPYLKRIKTSGYAGIKIHPRFSQITLEHDLLPGVIEFSGELALPVFLCTYFYDRYEQAYRNNVENLQKLLARVHESRIILLHGGSVRLLEMMELVRVFKNVLLDLSFTLCKYAGSSLDLDIQYLFKNFDRRICIGSDHPEISQKMLRERFEHFSQGLDREKAENIAFRNLVQFCGVKQ